MKLDHLPYIGSNVSPQYCIRPSYRRLRIRSNVWPPTFAQPSIAVKGHLVATPPKANMIWGCIKKLIFAPVEFSRLFWKEDDTKSGPKRLIFAPVLKLCTLGVNHAQYS